MECSEFKSNNASFIACQADIKPRRLNRYQALLSNHLKSRQLYSDSLLLRTDLSNIIIVFPPRELKLALFIITSSTSRTSYHHKQKSEIFLGLLILSILLHFIGELFISKMAGYQLLSDDLTSVLPKYMCKHCGFLLRDAMQAPCAHFYCRACLEHLNR